MDWKILLVLALVGVVLVSGCTEPLDEGAGNVKASLEAWLGTAQGGGSFPGGIAGEPIRVWREGEVFYWIAPVKDSNGLYIGNVVTEQEGFTIPKQVTEYSEPRERILNTTRDEAYQWMIMESGYPAYQISRPIVVTVDGRSLNWYSEVRSGGELIDELYVGIFVY
jgi:hypothetical protein